MRDLAPGEILSLGALLQMEINALAVAKASYSAMNNEQLKALAEAGVAATQGRIKGLQQFITDNRIADIKEVQ